MEPVTYSLKLDRKNSEEYYKDIDLLADQLILQAQNSITILVDNYIEFLKIYSLEEIREKEEYILELLSFGILWRKYSRTALSVNFAPYIFLAYMGQYRKKYQRLKPIIDFTRGILISFFLLPDTRKKYISTQPTIQNIDHVCKWFEATGEFREQALRFVRWRAYWGTLSNDQQNEIFSTIAKFVDWFEVRSLKIIGNYTENVDSFLLNIENKYKWREDRISCNRSRIEYHLNMVGACLLNRAFKKEFIDTDATAVLLPGCMRARSNSECEAVKEAKGLKCSGCENKCNVNQIRLAGLKKNYEVYVIPHASDLSLWSPKEGEPRKGVIASACVTTLVEGGWELKRYGVPAQCVLLENSGCQKHWHPVGVQTEINKYELNRIVSGNAN